MEPFLRGDRGERRRGPAAGPEAHLPHCKEEYRPSAEEFAAVRARPGPEVLYRGRGCKECRNIGYSGRMALYEVFGSMPQVRRMVIEGADGDTIRRSAAGQRDDDPSQAGFRRVAQGDTTLEESDGRGGRPGLRIDAGLRVRGRRPRGACCARARRRRRARAP